MFVYVCLCGFVYYQALETVVLSLILFHGPIPQSADLNLMVYIKYWFPMFITHVIWILESLDVDMFSVNKECS